MGVSDQLHAPATLSQKKITQVITGQEAGWDPKPSWTRCGREKKSILRLPWEILFRS